MLVPARARRAPVVPGESKSAVKGTRGGNHQPKRRNDDGEDFAGGDGESSRDAGSVAGAGEEWEGDEGEEEEEVRYAPTRRGRRSDNAPVGYCGYEHSGDAKVWTPAEDSLLLEIVKKGQPKAPRWLWALVAEPLVGRSKLAVARHWHTKYRPSYGLPTSGPDGPFKLPQPTPINTGAKRFVAAPFSNASSLSRASSSAANTVAPRSGFIAPYRPPQSQSPEIKAPSPAPLLPPPAATPALPTTAVSDPNAPRVSYNWTPEQLELLRELCQPRTQSWRQIAERCGGRTEKAAENAWHQMRLKKRKAAESDTPIPESKYSVWTEEQLELLKTLATDPTLSWIQVAERCGRTANCVSCKWRAMQARGLVGKPLKGRGANFPHLASPRDPRPRR